MFQIERTCPACGGLGRVWGNGDRIPKWRWPRYHTLDVFRDPSCKRCMRCCGSGRESVTMSHRQLCEAGLDYLFERRPKERNPSV